MADARSWWWWLVAPAVAGVVAYVVLVAYNAPPRPRGTVIEKTADMPSWLSRYAEARWEGGVPPTSRSFLQSEASAVAVTLAKQAREARAIDVASAAYEVDTAIRSPDCAPIAPAMGKLKDSLAAQPSATGGELRAGLAALERAIARLCSFDGSGTIK